MSPFEDATKKVYPKERWPCGLIHSDSESDVDEQHHIVRQDNVSLPIAVVQDRPEESTLTSILKNDSNRDVHYDENQRKSKSVAFNLNGMSGVNVTCNSLKQKGNTPKTYKFENNNGRSNNNGSGGNNGMQGNAS